MYSAHRIRIAICSNFFGGNESLRLPPIGGGFWFLYGTKESGLVKLVMFRRGFEALDLVGVVLRHSFWTTSALTSGCGPPSPWRSLDDLGILIKSRALVFAFSNTTPPHNLDLSMSDPEKWVVCFHSPGTFLPRL